ncbi:IclR family transcriptional regulator [Roseomonas sp. BN140053]|uniref:IclR family transcriptional regulator n=1 Tax=Roseomonas sp. BN140053 TaxID=3391898 RepID=UPI0039E96980
MNPCLRATLPRHTLPSRSGSCRHSDGQHGSTGREMAGSRAATPVERRHGAVPAGPGTGSLRKALRLMSELASAGEDGLRLTEVVGRTGLDPSTAHRMMACMVAENFLQKDERKRYRLGRRVFELGLAAESLFGENRRAQLPLERLAARIEAVAILNLRSSGETVYLNRIQSPEPVDKLHGTVGTRLPIGIGAGGIALLAAMPPEEAEAILLSNEKQYRRFGRNTSAILRGRLAQARSNGFAVTESFFRPGTSALGMVLPACTGMPTLALGVVGPSLGSGSMERVLAEMRSTAREIAAALDAGPAG